MLSTSKLNLVIAKRRLLIDLDWQVERGQCWCIIGRNGAGKSTLLRTLAGLHACFEGEVAIQGKPLAAWPLLDLARERAFLPQSHADPFGYSALETVLSARHPYQAQSYWESEEDAAIAWRSLQAMEVADLAARDVRSLSGGERQRVAIAALLAQETPLLLLDEPANALDLAHQMAVMHLLARLCRQENKSVVMVGHDLNLAHRVASHVLLLFGDGSWQAGSVEQVMRADILQACLGYPIEVVQHGRQQLFVPVEMQAI